MVFRPDIDHRSGGGRAHWAPPHPSCHSNNQSIPSLNLSDLSDFNRFGKYFEAFVEVEDSTLKVFGSDYSKNNFDVNFYDIFCLYH